MKNHLANLAPQCALAALLLLSGDSIAAGATPPKLMPMPVQPMLACKPEPSWSQNGSDTLRCGLSVLRHAAQVNFGGSYEAAFRQGELAGVKGLLASETRAGFGQSGWWKESGSVGEPVQLWWGRGNDDQLWALGYESNGILGGYLLRTNYRTPQVFMEYAAGKMIPFSSAKVTYSQYAALQTLITGGLGGTPEPIEPATVSGATLVLSTLPTLEGILQFDLQVEGKKRAYQIPLKRNVQEDGSKRGASENLRLKAGALHPVAGKIADCPPVKFATSAGCDFDLSDIARNSRETYNAHGIFFGPNSEFLAIRFDIGMDIAERNRTWATAKGLIILRAKPVQ